MKGTNDLDTFRKELKENMQKELDNAIKLKIKEQVMDGLLAIHDVSVPRALIEEEAARMRNQMVQQYGSGMKIEPDMSSQRCFLNRLKTGKKFSCIGISSGKVRACCG